MSIKIEVANPIIYEQIMSYNKCKNLLRSSLVHTSDLRKHIYCTALNTSKTNLKVSMWLSVENLETKARFDQLPKIYYSDKREALLKPGQTMKEVFKLETPRMTGIFQLKLNTEFGPKAKQSFIVIPTIQRIMTSDGIVFHEMEKFEVYSHRSGIQHNNQHSLFLFQTRKNFAPEKESSKKRKIETLVADDDNKTNNENSSDSDSDFDPKNVKAHKKQKTPEIPSRKRKQEIESESNDEDETYKHRNGRNKEISQTLKKTKSKDSYDLDTKTKEKTRELSIQEIYEKEASLTSSDTSSDGEDQESPTPEPSEIDEIVYNILKKKVKVNLK